MSGLTKEQVTYQVAQWAANDREVLERARKIIDGTATRSSFQSQTNLLAGFIGDIVHSNGNGLRHVADLPQGEPIDWSKIRTFWDGDAVQGLRDVVDRHDFYVTGVDWATVVEELKPW